MKKTLCLLLAALLVLSLAACGKQPATPTPDPTPDPAPNEAPKLVEALIPAEEYPDIVWENAGGGPCWNENYIVTVGNDDSSNSKTIFYSTNRQTGETRSTELDGLWISDSLALYGDSFYWLTIEANKETGERELLLLKYDCATLEKPPYLLNHANTGPKIASWPSMMSGPSMYLLSRIPNMRSAGTPLPMKRTTP